MATGFALQKNSAYAPDFDLALARIQDGQLDWKLQKKYLLKPKQCKMSEDTVRLEDTQGVFFIFVGGLGTAFLSLCAEGVASSQVWLDVVNLLYYVCRVMKSILMNEASK
jgi:hypothetical protein